jgi:DNA invertase Pin-like site-specific DNA recombinase
VPKKEAEPTVLAAYLRVSTAGQAESGIGMAAQREAILTAVEDASFVVGEWFEDAGKSGASLRNRPGLQAALDAVTRGDAGGLVVAKIDRLGRSYDVMTLVGRAAKEGWRLLALDVSLDTSTPEGELVAGALTMAARFEYRRISTRQNEKHERLRALRVRRGGDAVPAGLADELRAWRADGWTFRRIAAELNERREPTVRGGDKWHPTTVRSAINARERELAVPEASEEEREAYARRKRERATLV